MEKECTCISGGEHKSQLDMIESSKKGYIKARVLSHLTEESWKMLQWMHFRGSIYALN